MNVDNIIIGTLLVPEIDLGIDHSEDSIRFSFQQAQNANNDLFLPAILVKTHLFKSTSEIRQINKQRQKNNKFKNDPNQNLWRIINRPELTRFKIGKRIFWLIIGEE